MIKMMNVNVNYVAVLVAAIASMIVGYLWYSKAILGGPWMKEMGMAKESMEKAKKGMGKMYALSFVLALVTAYTLSHLMALSENYLHYSKTTNGLTSGFFAWLGFVMPVQATDVLFGGKKPKLFWINTGYQLASLLVMGLVIGLMG